MKQPTHFQIDCYIFLALACHPASDELMLLSILRKVTNYSIKTKPHTISRKKYLSIMTDVSAVTLLFVSKPVKKHGKN